MYFLVGIFLIVVVFTVITNCHDEKEEICRRCSCRKETWMGQYHEKYCNDCLRLISTGLDAE